MWLEVTLIHQLAQICMYMQYYCCLPWPVAAPAQKGAFDVLGNNYLDK